jgi:hypothetical protein
MYRTLQKNLEQTSFSPGTYEISDPEYNLDISTEPPQIPEV